MKNLLFTTLLSISTFASYSQSRFCIDISQDLTSSHIKYSDFKTVNPGFNFGATSISMMYSYNSNGNFYFEPVLNFTVLKDSTKIQSSSFQELNPDTLSIGYTTQTILNQYSNGTKAGTQHYTFGFNLMNKVSDYFYIGGGINFTFYKSVIADNLITEAYNHNGSNYVLVSRSTIILPYSRNAFSLSVPIIIRGYFPIKNHAIRLSLIGHLSTKARLEAAIGFCF